MIEVAAHGGGARVASGGRNPVESTRDTDAGLADTTSTDTRTAHTANTDTRTAATDAEIPADANATDARSSHATGTSAWTAGRRHQDLHRLPLHRVQRLVCPAPSCTHSRATTADAKISTCSNPAGTDTGSSAADSEITARAYVSSARAGRSKVVQSVVRRQTEEATELAAAWR